MRPSSRKSKVSLQLRASVHKPDTHQSSPLRRAMVAYLSSFPSSRRLSSHAVGRRFMMSFPRKCLRFSGHSAMWVMPLSKAVISAMCWPILTWVMMLP